MPTIPKQLRTVSQLIPSQLPDFIQDDYPMFVAFLKAYYEWLESNGTPVWNGKVLKTTFNTIVLTDTAATTVNAYQNMFIVCLNGPAKGATKKIKSYDPSTFTVTLVDSWEPSNIPPANTLMEIRDSSSPEKLLEYRDIDYTLDRFIDYFRDEFMYLIPGNILADKRNIVKHIKDFYQAKGTENSFRFLFRILFNEELEFYYPKVDLFRTSDARWFTQNIMKITTTGKTFDYLNRQLIGVHSGATAKVESVTQQIIPQGTISTLTLSSIDGTFTIDPNTGNPEQVKIVYRVNPPAQTDLGSITDLEEPFDQLRYESTYQLLQKLLIDTPGDSYQVGELITIDGGGSLSAATAVITSIFQTYYNGSCSVPPSVFYLEPYFGPNDFVNPTQDFTQDGVCIPGMYYFSDVHSSFTDADLLNTTQIMLAQNETTQDDFFAGDEIALVGGTGVGQKRKIVSYNGTSKVATVDVPWSVIPDGTTQYSITHVRGGIKSIKILDFGLGFVSTPTVTIHTALGSGAVLPPTLGLVSTTAGEWTAGRAGGIGGFPTTPDSMPSTNKIIQDSYYWQDFSYDLRFGQTVDKYRDVVKKLLHPAGMKMFGSVLLKTNLNPNFLETIQHYTIQFEAKLLDTKLKVFEEKIFHTLHLNTIDSKVVGATNKDFDLMKFRVFPPDSFWTTTYPAPNQNYWAPGATGNTQIKNLKDRTIGSFVNFPDQRMKIAADTEIKIENASSVSVVGPVGQTRAAISQFRFLGFPDYNLPTEGNSFGNTQIENLKDIVLTELIVTPDVRHSNICVDGEIEVFLPGDIPQIGNLVEYAFQEGIDPQIVYNVSPVTAGNYDGVLGNTILVETVDGTWIPQGVALDSSQNEIVNATGVPLDLSQCTVLVFAMAPDVSTDMALVSSISSDSDNGFSIDLRDNGGISFRVQYNNTAKVVAFPDATVKGGNYFMAALRFDHGKVTGRVNNSRTLGATYPNYPAAPVANTPGWFFGSPSPDYIPTAETASLYEKSLFGTNKFSQAQVTSSPIPVGYFKGTLVYAFFYDRPLYDYEVDSIYFAMRVKLQAERGITLHDTTPRINLGTTRIQRRVQQTQSGHFYIVKRQFQTGVSRMQQHHVFNQTGLSNIYATTQQGQTGVTALRNSNTQIQNAVSRVQKTVPQTRTGVSRVLATTALNQYGTSLIVFQTDQTQDGLSRITATAQQNFTGSTRVRQTVVQTMAGVAQIENILAINQFGVSRITATTLQNRSGVSAIQNTNVQVQQGVTHIVIDKDQTGVSRIQITTPQTQDGVSRIYNTGHQFLTGDCRITVTTDQTQSGHSSVYNTTVTTLTGVTHIVLDVDQMGVSRIQVTTEQDQLGVSRIQVTTDQDQSGVANIQNTTEQDQMGVSNITP
jgi:hypothetical protein